MKRGTAAEKRAIYRLRAEAGTCVACGKTPAVGGKRRCAACSQIASERAVKYLARVQSACANLCICIFCREREAMPKRQYCGVCAEIRVERQLDLRKRWKDAGACTRCGKARDREDRVCCATCREKHNIRGAAGRPARIARHRKLREARRKAGLCPRCGGARDCAGLMCSACLGRAQEARNRLRPEPQVAA